MIYYTPQKPTQPGWYWCRNDGDKPEDIWEVVVRVDATPDGLVCSWMTAPGEADTMHESKWSPDARWAGPITPPVVILG